jgi:sugar lactone lactonase YvrE
MLFVFVAAAAPIPQPNRIVGTVARSISAPANRPMTMPTDVAVDARGLVYVADGVNDRIVRFTAQGEFDAEIRGAADSLISRPIGIAIDGAGALWIADTGNHRLLRRDLGADRFEPIALPAAGPDKPTDPTGLTVCADGSRTYVADCDNHRILVRDNRSGAWTALGEFGISLGQFRWPFMMCLGVENHVLITESVGARVQQISAENRWGGQIGHFGVAMGDLYRPKGIAVDGSGRIWVGDSSMGVIQAFDPGGNLLGVLTDESGLPLRFAHPMGMRFDAGGSLYVVELGANRVAVVTFKQQSHGP